MKAIQTPAIWLAFALLAAVVALVLWLLGLVTDPSGWQWHQPAQGGAWLSLCLLLMAWARSLYQQEQAAKRFLDALSRYDAHEHAGELSLIELPSLASGNPWYATCMRLKDAFAKDGNRTHAAEHARAALEVRVQRMRQELEQIRSILDGLSEPVLAVDAYDEVVLANPGACRLFGIELEDAPSRALDDLIPYPELVETLSETRRRKTAGQRTAEFEFVSEDGPSRWFRITATSLEQEEGPSRGAVAVLRDISSHKAIQKRNAEFVSAVSHEMKTPLAGIKAYVELLADGDAEDPQTQEEFLDVINTQTDRLQRLIDNLLNLARIEAGVVDVNKETQSLNEMLEHAFDVVGPAAEAKNIELVNDLSPMYLGVLADRDMIMQAAINLLSNAIKYTSAGGTVTLRSRMKDNEVQFEVVDTGVGLSEEDCARVFDKFYRVRKDSGMAQGTGLGLPLAKHIVEDVHGGRLELESELGHGSLFRIILPGAGQLAATVATTS